MSRSRLIGVDEEGERVIEVFKVGELFAKCLGHQQPDYP
jgi:hypothetical protein